MTKLLKKAGLAKWTLIGAGWFIFALYFASEVVVSRSYAGRPPNIRLALSTWLICSALWFAATPLILWLAQRFPIDRQRWLSSGAVHLGFGVALSVFLLGLYVLVTRLFGIADAEQSLIGAFRNQLVDSFHTEVLTYGMVIGLSHAIDYYSKYRERELRASQLETRLAQAQLEALKRQLHPHFLFNTLNSVSVLMSEDVGAARRMLIRLSELLRGSLENAGAQEVTLREELEFLNNYLEIEQTRFQDRLTVRMDVETSLLDVCVPNLILQPLVENAIRHGIAPRSQPGLVEISAHRENGYVRLSVRDNGSGLGSFSAETLKKGIGLSNTEARLKQLYGRDHRFELSEVAGGGLRVTIEIPFRNGTPQTVFV